MASVRLLTQDGEKYFEVEGDGTALSPYRSVQQLSGSVAVTGTVDVASMPSIAVSVPSTIDIGTLPDVTISGVPHVIVDSLPSVAISGTPTVSISGVPHVIVDSLPNVTVSGTPNVAVTSLPAVTFSGTPNVAISGTPNVAVTSMPTVTVAALPTGTNIVGAVYDAGPKNASDRFYAAYADGSSAQFASSAPTGGQKRVLTDVVVSVSGDCFVELLEETTLTVLASAWVKGSCGFEQLVPRGKLKLATADKRLMVKTTPAAQISTTTLSYSEA